MDDLAGWLVAFGVCFVAYRVLFRGGDSSSGSSAPRRRVIPQAQVDQVAAVLPHLSESSIRYALEGSRGNVELVVERGLRQGGLPEPPAGYFPDPTPRPAPAPAALPALSDPAAFAASPTSLIERLGLQGRTSEESAGPVEGKGKGKEGSKWETTAEARERSLKERKERMVMEARRKLLEKERAKAVDNGSTAAAGPA